MSGAPPLPGLSSPGPCYDLPSCFDRAGVKAQHPTWGHHGPGSLKSGRFREDEVRFASRRHMREMLGHFSPGPQYALPSTIGGSTRNHDVARNRLNSQTAEHAHLRAQDLHKSSMPYTSCSDYIPAPETAKLSSAELGWTTMSNDAITSNQAASGAGKGTTEYWRNATMLSSQEPSMQGAGWATGSKVRQMATAPAWEFPGSQAHSKLQEQAQADRRAHWRPEASQPRRQVLDMRADPPLASTFGSLKPHTDYGVIGGMDNKWRESKIYNGSGGPKIGKPTLKTDGLRYAFIQKTGVNSIPVGTAKADFEGGRKTASVTPSTRAFR
jgi:hypothetical protein